MCGGTSLELMLRAAGIDATCMLPVDIIHEARQVLDTKVVHFDALSLPGLMSIKHVCDMLQGVPPSRRVTKWHQPPCDPPKRAHLGVGRYFLWGRSTRLLLSSMTGRYS